MKSLLFALSLLVVCLCKEIQEEAAGKNTVDLLLEEIQMLKDTNRQQFEKVQQISQAISPYYVSVGFSERRILDENEREEHRRRGRAITGGTTKELRHFTLQQYNQQVPGNRFSMYFLQFSYEFGQEMEILTEIREN